MGSALTNADSAKITCLIRNWCNNNRLTLLTDPESNCNKDCQSSSLKLYAQNAFYKIIWLVRTEDSGVEIDLDLKPHFYFNVILHTILFFGLFYCTFLINSIIRDYNYIQVSKLAIVSLLVMILIWWKDNRLSLKLAGTETSFWDMANQTIDIEHLTKTSGSIYKKQFRLLTEALFFGFVIYICSKVFGAYGFIASVLVGSLILIMIIAEIIRKDNPHWHWRFWIMRNMARWTFIMLMINAFFLVLFAVDIILPLQLYQSESPPSVQQVFKTAKLRDVKPAIAVNLEKDCYNYFWNMAEDEFNRYQENSDVASVKNRSLATEKNLKINSIAFLIILILVPLFFFAVRPFYCLLKAQKIWASEVSSKYKQHGPFVPYISKSWSWKTPIVLRGLIFLHCIIGGIINMTAVIFCIDGWSYYLRGKTLFFEKSANLWSWPFAISKISLGGKSGEVVGVFILILISLPLIFLFAAFARRALFRCIFLIRVIRQRIIHGDVLSQLQNFSDNVCKECKLKKPVIILTNSRDCIINLRTILFGQKNVVGISTPAIDFLSVEELKAVLAHELGHLKRGPWKIEILKLLSSVLLFPNYYLTLCIDWTSNEIEADRFAVNVTNGRKTLKDALVKTATYQLSHLNYRPKAGTNLWNSFINKVNEKLNSFVISIKFFFGDRLLGYIHPNLSERLEAIKDVEIE